MAELTEPAIERRTGRSAQYGQACLACFKSKCRCVPRPNGDGCQRCHRLQRPCQPADAGRRRSDKRQRLNSSDTRIARIEGRLEQLASLLQSNNGHIGDASNPNLPMPTPPSLPSHDDTAPDTDGSRRISDDAASDEKDDEEDEINYCTGGPWLAEDMDTANPAPLASSPSTPSWATVSHGSCLDAFRHKLHHCPFVHLPAHLTPEQLRQDRPFLFRAIACVVAPSTAEKRSRAVELKRVLFENVCRQQNRRQKLDLLLGLLVYIAWGWDHIHSGGSLPRLMAVAVSLAAEMCADQAPKPTISLVYPKDFEDWHGGSELTDALFLLERQRAALGCFLLGAAVADYFPQVDAPRWSPQMDECLSAVSISGTNSKYMFDGTLSFQVRLQLLAMKAAQTCERCQLPDQPPVTTLPGPALLYIKTLMVQIQDLRASIPPAFQHHVFPLVHTYYTELCIIETLRTQEIANAPPTGSTRLWYFWQSALAIKSCTSTFLTLSPSELLGVSFIQWTQLIRCIATLHSLCAPSDSGVDLTAVRRLVDLPALLSCTAEKLELASAEAGEQADGVFAQLAAGMRTFQTTSSESDRPEEAPGGAAADGDAGADADADADADANGDADAMMHAQQEEYLSNPTLWLDRFLIEHEEQQTVPPV